VSLNNFIPAIWSARLLENLNKSLVYASVANTDYQGDVTAGSSVKINAIGRVTVSSYTKSSDHAAAETLTDAQIVLNIDQQQMFNFQLDDVDAAQQTPRVMDQAMVEAGYALADNLDQYIAGLHASASSANLIGSTGTPVALTSSNAYETLVDLGVKLTKSNVSKAGRWVVVPPEFTALLLKDTRFIASGAEAGDARLISGLVGRAAGIDIYESVNVSVASSKYKVLAGSPQTITVANQIDSVHAYRPERQFSDALKGLHVYGAKVVRPDALACATVTF